MGRDTVPSPARVRHYADSLARAALESGPGAGLTIGVVRGGDTLVWGGWGEANVELDAPTGPGTIYRIGSVTKQFTAALVMREAQAGKLSLDDPISKYVPDYDTHGKTVTLRELLGHTGGVPNYTASPDFSKEMRLDLSDEQVLAMGERDSLDFDPGTAWSYSNTGFYLLGLVLEKVTGRPYDELVDDSLAAPLGLEHTSYCWNGPIVPGRADGYAASDSVKGRGKLDHPVLVNAEELSMGSPFSAGALCSSAGDLVRWTGLLHAGKVVSPASYRLMSTPDTLPNGLVTHYGFGLFIGDLDGHRVVFHGGGINGFLTHLARYPDDDMTVVVLSNATSVNPGPIGEKIARFALGIPAAEEGGAASGAGARSIPSGLAARVAGTYRMIDRTPLEVESKGDGLTLTMGEREPMKLRYLGGGGSGEPVFEPAGPPGMRFVFHLPEGSAPARRVTMKAGMVEVGGLRVKKAER
ncbi:MAG TPA: serine hydrolase domain-containing protein [Gemmatimonadota bacterium]|nr:serine hydrolase domain-containing protein [Gemmatimonadota bacterium]